MENEDETKLFTEVPSPGTTKMGDKKLRILLFIMLSIPWMISGGFFLRP